jgi:hypothetical protein
MNLAIIGCGIIGQRHFESILNLDYKMKIFLVDKSAICLNKCKKISLKKKKFKTFHFVNNINKIKENIDFVIIATNSKNRFSALKKLFKYKKPKFIILEKFLFNKPSYFEEARKLFQVNGTKVWVNQWMSSDFPNLKNIFEKIDKVNITVKGSNWNLCSNCVHWIDWFHHINDREGLVLFKSKLENLIISNKRKGFYETFGSLEFLSKNDSKLLLQCDYEKNGDRKSMISISNKTTKVEFKLTENSLNGYIFKSGKKERINFKLRYLSERTSVFIKNILEQNECSLPTYDQSVFHHKLIFQTLENHFNKNGLKKYNYLPVT